MSRPYPGGLLPPRTPAGLEIAGKPLIVTDPTGTRQATVYDAAGNAVTTYANYIDGTPRSTGLDDVKTSTTRDAFGNALSVIADDSGTGGQASGYITAKSASTNDVLGHAITQTTFGDTGWTDGRTTTSYFEVASGVTRPEATGVLGPITPGASAPACPGTSSPAHCTSVTTLDLSGQPFDATDAYGKHTRTYHDLAGRVGFTIADYVDGAMSSTTGDDDLITATAYDIAGKPVSVTDPMSRQTLTAYDALDRPVAVTRKDSAGADVNVAKTVYTPAGRVDHVSAPDKLTGITDAARTWSKTTYDAAGRATKTLAHYDITGAAGYQLADFEDRSVVAWTATGGASAPINDAATTKTGVRSLKGCGRCTCSCSSTREPSDPPDGLDRSPRLRLGGPTVPQPRHGPR